jgi:peptidoglycan hydrolase-like amidase
MEMARQGFSFSDILRFYYHQVQIRDIVNIPDEQLPEEFRGIR